MKREFGHFIKISLGILKPLKIFAISANLALGDYRCTKDLFKLLFLLLSPPYLLRINLDIISLPIKKADNTLGNILVLSLFPRGFTVFLTDGECVKFFVGILLFRHILELFLQGGFSLIPLSLLLLLPLQALFFFFFFLLPFNFFLLQFEFPS